MRRIKCYPKHTMAYKVQQQQALPFHFIFIIFFPFFFFLYFAIIKFLEFVSIYIVSWRELCVYLLNMFLFSRLVKLWPNMIKLFDFWNNLAKSEHPDSKSFYNVKSSQTLLLLLSGWIAMTIFNSFPRG